MEPFTGGGGVALDLLFSERVERIVLNDLDLAIYAFWYAVLRQNDEFCERVEKCSVTLEEREKQRGVYERKDRDDLLGLGFATFFLNRVNVSGILTAGVIGGNNQNGKYALSARFNKKSLLTRIKKIKTHSHRVELYNLDVVDLLG